MLKIYLSSLYLLSVIKKKSENIFSKNFKSENFIMEKYLDTKNVYPKCIPPHDEPIKQCDIVSGTD